ncbi:hypothetical protein B0H14DRAFT_359327 [Mycena olivaceomarginata]|nr:hypothetical protein B0H14DRAFT_359327 [Mycena olivaceomarginata]
MWRGRRGAAPRSGPAQRADVTANHFVSPAVQDALGISDPRDAGGAPAAKRAEQEQAQRGLLLPAREALLRRRVHQCVAVLELSSITEATRVTLRQSCVTPPLYESGWICRRGECCACRPQVHLLEFGLVGTSTPASVISIEAGGDHLEEDSRQIREGRTEDLLDHDSVEIAIASNLEFAPGICSGSLRARSAVLVPGAGIQCEVSLGRTSASVHLGRGHGHRTLRAAAPSARLLPLQDLTSTVKILTLLLELPRVGTTPEAQEKPLVGRPPSSSMPLPWCWPCARSWRARNLAERRAHLGARR